MLRNLGAAHLPNGLKYALKFNGIQANGIAFRLRIGTGSLKERDGEQGFAHFLEHMAFRGSTHVPDGELTHILQRQGLSFGADTNAFTTPEQTFFQLNFPKGDAAAADTGLMLLREIADRLTLDQTLIEQERGVVLSEERSSDQPLARVQRAEIALALSGTRAADRPPVGTIETIKAVTAAKLRRFYQEHYRPNNATLVVVGYFDVDAMERKIKEGFGDWESVPVAAPPVPNKLDSPPPAMEFVADGAPEAISLMWRAPPDLRPPTLDVERERLADQIGFNVINSRLNSLMLKPGSPMLIAMATWQPSAMKLAGVAKIGAAPMPGKWKEAVDQCTGVLRQLLVDGVTESDLKQVIPTIHAELQRQLSVAKSLSSAPIADAIVQADLNGSVYLSAWQTFQITEPMLATIKPEEVTASLRRVFGTSVPLVLRSAPAAAVGQAALADQVRQSMQRAIVPGDKPTNVADWPYTNFGGHSDMTGSILDPEMGTSTVQFANDTRLIVKTTDFDRDQVVVQVALGQGRSGILPQHLHTLWALDALPLGGTAKRSFGQFVEWQQASGRRLSIAMRTEPKAFVLEATTKRADLLAQLQVLAAFARDPGFRPELGEKLAAAGPLVVDQRSAQAVSVFEREFTRLMTGGDRRLAFAGFPESADVTMTKPGDLEAVLREPLGAAADIVIVGDVSGADAIAAVQATFGSGQPRTRAPKVELEVKSMPKPGERYSFTHSGRHDQAVLAWTWPLPDYWGERGVAAYTGAVAAAVLEGRLEETVRAKLGITYTPRVRTSASADVTGQGSWTALIETPPDKFDAFRELLKEQLSGLAAKPLSDDEFARARGPLVEASRKSNHSNAYWAFWLLRSFGEPRVKSAALNESAALQSVTAAQVQAFFRDRISNRPPIELAVQAN